MIFRLRLALSIIGLVTIFTQACSRPLPPEAACGFVRNGTQQRVSWAGRLPIKLYLHSSVPTEAYDAINHAIAEYKRTLGHGSQDIFQIVGTNYGGPVQPVQDGYSVIYWFTNWADSASEQARTTIYWSGKHITEADMRINADPRYFTYNYSQSTSFTDLDLDSLVLHELGHILGLAHNPTIGSVMNITLNEGQDRRAVGTVDEASLSCEY